MDLGKFIGLWINKMNKGDVVYSNCVHYGPALGIVLNCSEEYYREIIVGESGIYEDYFEIELYKKCRIFNCKEHMKCKKSEK